MKSTPHFDIINLGALGYVQAYQIQRTHLDQVVESRDSSANTLGRVLLVEHPPVITVTRRPDAASHVLADHQTLHDQGVQIHQTDRGGDVTYHGPGQLVCYPILDLNRAKLRLHDYMRLLESVVIDTLAAFNIHAHRHDLGTGVWVTAEDKQQSKICAMGLRVRRWVSMHGLAINVRTNLDHFNLIVPCGLSNRRVTSMLQILGHQNCPTIEQVQPILIAQLESHLTNHLAEHRAPKPHA